MSKTILYPYYLKVMVSNRMKYLKEAFREAVRREFADVPPETELSYEFYDSFEKRMLSLFNDVCLNNTKSCSFIDRHYIPPSGLDNAN